MLFTSTSEIYGDPLIHPQPEEYWGQICLHILTSLEGNVNTIGPRSCYDEGKRVCETLIYEYNKVYNLDCKIVRLFNTYVPSKKACYAGPKMALDTGIKKTCEWFGLK